MRFAPARHRPYSLNGNDVVTGRILTWRENRTKNERVHISATSQSVAMALENLFFAASTGVAFCFERCYTRSSSEMLLRVVAVVHANVEDEIFKHPKGYRSDPNASRLRA